MFDHEQISSILIEMLNTIDYISLAMDHDLSSHHFTTMTVNHQSQSTLWYMAIMEIGRLFPGRSQRLFFIRVFFHRSSIYRIENSLPTKEWELFINDMKMLQQYLSLHNRILESNDTLTNVIIISFITAWNSVRRNIN
jgi:hypothetical protein